MAVKREVKVWFELFDLLRNGFRANSSPLLSLSTMIVASTRLKELRDLIRNYDQYYYVLNAPQITDEDYDKLYRELVDLEAQHPTLYDPNSPTTRIGGLGSSGFIKTKHARRMLSLKNTYNAQEVFDFFSAGTELILEPKVDGLSLKVVYKEGQFTQAITRGNGEYGDDVTENARTIRSLPLVLLDPISIEVTGEVYMTYSAFNALNDRLEAEGSDLFANARNAASGSLKLKDPKEVAARHLSFAVHGCNTEFEGVDSQEKLIELLEGQGFQTMAMLPVLDSCPTVSSSVKLTNVATLTQMIEAADANRKFLDLATDGLVFKLNDLAQQRELGEGTKCPNWAVAYKFPPERKDTTLLGVTLQVGKSGKITPVAELKPVLLSGTLVRRASLCNAEEIKRLGLNTGDQVYVEKSAEIIPKVMGVASKVTEGVYTMPDTCPCCNTKLVREAGKVDYFCPNRDCDEQVFKRLKHATGKSALDIDGCGEAMIRELMEHGVRRLSQLLTVRQLNYLKPAARIKLQQGQEAAKKQPFWRQLHALGIDEIGHTKCQEIAAQWSSLISIVDEIQLAKFKDMFKEVAYNSFIDYLGREAEEISALEEAGLVFATEKAQLGKLSGKVFAITGVLMSGSRDQVIRRIEAKGGMVKSNVSTKVHYLVVGADPGMNKTTQAEKLGVSTIGEDKLYEMMGEPMPLMSSVEPDREY